MNSGDFYRLSEKVILIFYMLVVNDEENIDFPKEQKRIDLTDSIGEKKIGDDASADWISKFLEMDLLSPVYIFIFIVLFKDGKDGVDLHDAIISFVIGYSY